MSGKDDVILDKAKQGTGGAKQKKQAARGTKEDTRAAGGTSESEEDEVVLDKAKQGTGGAKEKKQAARGANEDTQATGQNRMRIGRTATRNPPPADTTELEEDDVVLHTVRQASGGEATNNVASSAKIQFGTKIIDIDEL